MKKNDVIRMTADHLGSDLEGICHVDGQAVFVPGMLPGETADVHIVQVKSRFAFGKLKQLTGSPSPVRRATDCSAYPKCGGCTCRHMTYETTLQAKQQQVRDCFARIAGLNVDVPPVLGMDQPFRYRNKTSLPVGLDHGKISLGFYAPRSHTLIPITTCPNAMDPAEKICSAFVTWAEGEHLTAYNEETHTGLLRHLMIRVNNRGESMVVPIINGQRLPHAETLTDMLKPLGTVSLILNRNTERTNVILGNSFQTLYGSDTLSDTLCGLKFELSAPSFFQVNPTQTEALYRTALDFADPSPDSLLCDVYCGAGTISLMMAQHCRRVIGIEIVLEAIENARENARRNHIDNCTFHAGAAEELLPQLVKDGLKPDIIVVDPPRKGLDPQVIQAIAEAAPERIVYVSCNVATQARDAGLLAALGYLPVRVQPVDMFCWTGGVENVILLSKLSSAKHINIHLDMTELDVTRAETDEGATYKEIKAWIKEHTGLKVSSLYIAQVKRKFGIIERECYNKPKSEDSHQPQCPEDKEQAIVKALKAFKMIEQQ